MGKFKSGDVVVTSSGAIATVLDSVEHLAIQWVDGCTGSWPASAFELVPLRKFRPGDFVRVIADDDTNGIVGMVFEDDGSDEDDFPYWVSLYDVEQSEEPYSADELIPWVPHVGERVIEADVDDEETGTVLSIGNGTVSVLWESFPHAQNWPLSDLDPVEEKDFVVGDVVEYSHPVFTNLEKATVMGVGDGHLHVVFDSGFLPEGNYTKDVFKLAA